MKKIIVILLMLLVFNYADAQKKAVNKIPRSEPEKWLFVGTASTDNMFVMFQDAVMDAMNDFFDYYDRIYSTESHDEVTGTCSIEFVKHKMDDDILYVWLEVKPDGKYSFVTSHGYVSSSMYSSDNETDTYEKTRKTTVSLDDGCENMELQFWNELWAKSQSSVNEKNTDALNTILMNLKYTKKETYHSERK